MEWFGSFGQIGDERRWRSCRRRRIDAAASENERNSCDPGKRRKAGWTVLIRQ
jgi:hypothetical protein